MELSLTDRMLQVDQAVFASSDRGRVKGYQLVGQSLGIDSAIALELTRWAPTQLPSDAPENWTISCWQPDDQSYVIARTVYGGPEYSNRGGTQVVTIMLVLSDEQFSAYDYDAMAVVRTAMALGYLRLPVDLRRDLLPTVELPSFPILSSSDHSTKLFGSDLPDSLLDEVAALVIQSQPIALIGFSDPVEVAERIISRLTFDQRRSFSFTTGLSPSIRRPLQAHFYQRPDVARHRALESQDVICIQSSGKVLG